MNTLRVITPNGKLFPNPYVVKMVSKQYDITEFIKILQQAKKMFTVESWAYSPVQTVTIININPIPWIVNGHSRPGPKWNEEYASYWAFSDEQDALQFRFKFKDSTHAIIWPSRTRFTIIDYIES